MAIVRFNVDKVLDQAARRVQSGLVRAAHFLIGEVRKDMAQPKSGRLYKKPNLIGRRGWGVGKWTDWAETRAQKTAARGGAYDPFAELRTRRGMRGGLYRASAPGESPAVRTGELSRSLTFELIRQPRTLIVRVGTNRAQGKAMEYGYPAKGLRPRPAWRKNLHRHQGRIRSLIAGG